MIFLLSAATLAAIPHGHIGRRLSRDRGENVEKLRISRAN
jgi:hypothetical protein